MQTAIKTQSIQRKKSSAKSKKRFSTLTNFLAFIYSLIAILSTCFYILYTIYLSSTNTILSSDMKYLGIFLILNLPFLLLIISKKQK